MVVGLDDIRERIWDLCTRSMRCPRGERIWSGTLPSRHAYLLLLLLQAADGWEMRPLIELFDLIRKMLTQGISRRIEVLRLMTARTKNPYNEFR